MAVVCVKLVGPPGDRDLEAYSTVSRAERLQPIEEVTSLTAKGPPGKH